MVSDLDLHCLLITFLLVADGANIHRTLFFVVLKYNFEMKLNTPVCYKMLLRTVQ